MQSTIMPDFVKLKHRFEQLDKGSKAELGKRVQLPDDLVAISALYRLFPGENLTRAHRRLVFFLPFCEHREDAEPLGRQLAKAGIRQPRVFQVFRGDEPNDLIQLRRLVMHIKPAVDWSKFGTSLWYWGEISKQRLLEDYLIALNSNDPMVTMED